MNTNTGTMQAEDDMLNDSMDDLLDGTLDDLADMPEFKPLPPGAHRLTIKWDYSTFPKDKIIKLEAKVVETVELSNATKDEPAKPGDELKFMFFFLKSDGSKSEFGEGAVKALLKPLSDHFGASSLRDSMDKSQGCEVLAITKLRADKRDKSDIKYYTEIVSWTPM